LVGLLGGGWFRWEDGELILTSDVLFVVDLGCTDHAEPRGHHKEVHSLLKSRGAARHPWHSPGSALRVLVGAVRACTVQSEFALNLFKGIELGWHLAYIRMHVHALFAVGTVGEVLAVLLGVEIRASLIGLSAVRVVLALDLFLVGCIPCTPAALLLPWLVLIVLCRRLEPDVVLVSA
jgi:hypothetical protein